MCSLILLPKSGFGVKLFSYLGCKTGWTAKLVHELEEFYGEILVPLIFPQGYDYTVGDPSMTYRIETMPGLGW